MRQTERQGWEWHERVRERGGGTDRGGGRDRQTERVGEKGE